MWLYVNLFCLCVCVGTYLVETMSWNHGFHDIAQIRALSEDGDYTETC